MKLVSSLLLIGAFAIAQEIQQIPAYVAAKIAQRVTASLGSPADAPFPVDPDLTKPGGVMSSWDTVLIALPDRKLTPDTLAAAGREVVAVGHLWMHHVVPFVNGAATAPEKLRSFAMPENGREKKVEAYFLGVAKSDAGVLELSVYGKDRAPLIQVPVVKTDGAASAVPIHLDGRKAGERTGTLIITLFGAYRAEVTVIGPPG
ncbi:MAG: hypothetical protein ABIP20_02490 [Chthoniobacteraceae bacterium]